MLQTLTIRQLKRLASGEKIKGYSHLRKDELVTALTPTLATGRCELPLSEPETDLVSEELVTFLLVLGIFCLVWSGYVLFFAGLWCYRFGMSTRQWLTRFENTGQFLSIDLLPLANSREMCAIVQGTRWALNF